MSSHFEVIGDEWRSRSYDLASWAWERLVNRKDVWGQYTAPKKGSKKSYSALTLPQKKMRGKDMVSLDKLERHFGSAKRHYLIGLHSQSAEHTCKWCAIDIDLHDCDDRLREDVARRNYSAATGWWETLQIMGYDPLLLDSNGKGGYHLIVLFDSPVPIEEVFEFCQQLVADWEQRNLDFAPETFPKSATTDAGKLGAWLRLPGRHHTHDHFTRVWSGDAWLDEPWLSGMGAIDALLSATPGPPPRPKRLAKKTCQLKKVDPPKSKSRPRSICIDLDGVLCHYDHWQGIEHFGDPITGAVAFTIKMAEEYRVIIFSARTHGEPGRDLDEAVRLVGAWLDRHGFAYDEIYIGVGKPLASAYIDDRGVACCPQQDGVKAFEIASMQIEKLTRK